MQVALVALVALNPTIFPRKVALGGFPCHLFIC